MLVTFTSKPGTLNKLGGFAVFGWFWGGLGPRVRLRVLHTVSAVAELCTPPGRRSPSSCRKQVFLGPFQVQKGLISPAVEALNPNAKP